MTRERLDVALAELDDPSAVEMVVIDSAGEAEALGMRGSPTILVDDRDLFGVGSEAGGLACRTYVTPDGTQRLPTVDQIRGRLSQ